MINTETATPAAIKETKKNVFKRAIDKFDRFDEKHPLATSAIFGVAAAAVIAPALIYINNMIDDHFENSENTNEDNASN